MRQEWRDYVRYDWISSSQAVMAALPKADSLPQMVMFLKQTGGLTTTPLCDSDVILSQYQNKWTGGHGDHICQMPISEEGSLPGFFLIPPKKSQNGCLT